jgi:subtilase family serine protease
MALAAVMLVCVGLAAAQGAPIKGVPIRDNHPSEIAQLGELSRAAANRRLDLKIFLSLRNRPELDALLAAQQDPTSPQYHQWLTPAQFATRFDPGQSDLIAIANWLNGAGFRLTALGPDRHYVAFTGSVAQAERVFGVTIVATTDSRMFTNLEDPIVPAGLAGLVAHLEGLDNLRRFAPLIRSSRRRRHPVVAAAPRSFAPTAFVNGGVPAMPPFERSSPSYVQPQIALGGDSAFGPIDIQTFYDETPLLSDGINGGKGSDCIAVIEDSDYKASAVTLFDTTFALPAAVISNFFPTNDPGINSDEGETLLDLEYAHAAAPNAPLRAYIGNDTTAIIDPIADGIQKAVKDNACSVISISFSNCGGASSYFTGTLDPMFAQAASQGQSVIVASDDFGAAGQIVGRDGNCATATNRHVNEVAADPNVIAAGGTEFTPEYNSSGDDVGFVAEDTWNEATDGGASGGGASAIFSKPAWQKGVTPSDGQRDLPDLAIIASPDMPGVFMGDDASDEGSGCPRGQSCINCCAGGTSLSAPLVAGISRILEQTASRRVGNLGPLLYSLGSESSTALRDVTIGNNDFNGVTGFSAGVGYDQATGWGSPDITLLAQAVPTATPTPISSGTLSLSATAIAFPTTGVDTTANSSFNITNGGPGVLAGTISTGGLGPSFSLAASTSTSFSIANGHLAKVAIQFAPTSPGIAAGSLMITSSDPKHSPKTVTVSGKAVSGALSGPATLSFGAVKADSTKSTSITIKNTGLGVLQGSVSTSNLPAAFDVLAGTGSFELKDGQTQPITVKFQPPSKGNFSGTIAITSDGGNLTVTVTGTGF